MKNYFILLLLSVSFSIFSQEIVELEEAKYDKKNKSYLVKIKDKVTYNLLLEWTDEMITNKYTGVEGILAYALNRKNEHIIEAEILEKNADFLLGSYLNLKEEDIKVIKKKKVD